MVQNYHACTGFLTVENVSKVSCTWFPHSVTRSFPLCMYEPLTFSQHLLTNKCWALLVSFTFEIGEAWNVYGDPRPYKLNSRALGLAVIQQSVGAGRGHSAVRIWWWCVHTCRSSTSLFCGYSYAARTPHTCRWLSSGDAQPAHSDARTRWDQHLKNRGAVQRTGTLEAQGSSFAIHGTTHFFFLISLQLQLFGSHSSPVVRWHRRHSGYFQHWQMLWYASSFF